MSDAPITLNGASFDEMNSHLLSSRDLARALENISLSADAKLIIEKVKNVTLDVGGKIVNIGNAILGFALELLKLSPTTIFGALIGGIMGILIASVPVFGALLGPILAPLLMAFGIGSGAVADIMSGGLGDRIRAFADLYSPLVPAA